MNCREPEAKLKSVVLKIGNELKIDSETLSQPAAGKCIISQTAER